MPDHLRSRLPSLRSGGRNVGGSGSDRCRERCPTPGSAASAGTASKARRAAIARVRGRAPRRADRRSEDRSWPAAIGGRRAFGGQRGLTLLELLVTLVIAAMLVGLLSQSVSLVYRIEALLADERLRGQALLLRVEWLRHSLAGLQPGDRTGQGALRGSARDLTGRTTNPIGPNGGGWGELSLKMRFEPESGETVLETVGLAPERRAQPLLRWPGDVGRFGYLRRDGTLEPQWPPALGAQDALPAAVVVETALPGFTALIAVPQTVESNLPSRRDYERL